MQFLPYIFAHIWGRHKAFEKLYFPINAIQNLIKKLITQPGMNHTIFQLSKVNSPAPGQFVGTTCLNKRLKNEELIHFF